MGKDGFYVFHKPEHPLTEVEAKKLIRQLTEDTNSDDPLWVWKFNPNRSSLSAFVGHSSDDSESSFQIEREDLRTEIHVQLTAFAGPISRYSVIDLCYEPEKSELLRLYTQIAKTVHAAAWARGTISTQRTITTE